MSKSIQSAVNPVSNVAANLGAKSLPILVAGRRNILGLYFFTNSIRTVEYVSVRYSPNKALSHRNILSIPCKDNFSANFDKLFPRRTAQTLSFEVFASSFAFPSSSKETPLILSFFISINIHISSYSAMVKAPYL